MIEIVRGPGSKFPDPNFGDAHLNTSLRIITSYLPATDAVVMRLDVLVGAKRGPDTTRLMFEVPGVQLNVSIQSSSPNSGDLFIPPSNVISAFAVRVVRDDLSAALRGLADAIDAEPK